MKNCKTTDRISSCAAYELGIKLKHIKFMFVLIALSTFGGCSYTQTQVQENQVPGPGQPSTPPAALDPRISILGPLKYRPIIKVIAVSKSPMGTSVSVSCRVWVNGSGNVKENIHIEKSSGNIGVDESVISLIKEIKFKPIPNDQIQEDEWGIVTIRLDP